MRSGETRRRRRARAASIAGDEPHAIQPRQQSVLQIEREKCTRSVRAQATQDATCSGAHLAAESAGANMKNRQSISGCPLQVWNVNAGKPKRPVHAREA